MPAVELKNAIEKAIEDLVVTRAEYDHILHIANEDHHISKMEKVLLEQLNEMIDTKHVKMVP